MHFEGPAVSAAVGRMRSTTLVPPCTLRLARESRWRLPGVFEAPRGCRQRQSP